MLLFVNPPLTGKRGRPRATECKRGHARVPGELSCVACRRYRYRLKYEMDAAFRERKCQYQSAYRKSFFEKNGYWPC